MEIEDERNKKQLYGLMWCRPHASQHTIDYCSMRCPIRYAVSQEFGLHSVFKANYCNHSLIT